ncbi:MAG: YicC family protein, partial [Bacteroidota bacterium]
NELTKLAERGKVDFTITIEPGPETNAGIFNSDLIGAYLKELRSISSKNKAPLTDELSTVLRLPNVLNTERNGASDQEWKSIMKLFAAASKEFNDFRSREGKALQKDFELRLKNIRALLKQIEKAEPLRNEGIRSRMQKNLAEIAENTSIDRNRFEQEVIYYMEKMDITEEKVRLKTHLDYFDEVLSSKDSVGKKLGFILQEIGREINTIGSKANDANIQRFVVEMKDELEKMKEQSANIV